MKNALLSFCTLIFASSILMCQVQDISTSVNGPSGMIKYKDALYISEYNAGKVSKLNLQEETPIVEDVITGLLQPFGLGIHEEYLIITDQLANKIFLPNLEDETQIDSIQFINKYPIEAIVIDDYLYFSAVVGTSIFEVGRAPLSNLNSIEIISSLTGITPTGFEYYNNKLYMASVSNGIIYTMDLQSQDYFHEEFATNLLGPNHLFIDGDELYVSEFDGSRISKFDLSVMNPERITVSTNLDAPTGLVVCDDILYFGQFLTNKISKLHLDSTATLDEEKTNQYNISFFPNPTSDNIYFENLLSGIPVQLFNDLGHLVFNGSVSINNPFVSLEKFPAGKYFIKTGNQASKLIIKF